MLGFVLLVVYPEQYLEHDIVGAPVNNSVSHVNEYRGEGAEGKIFNFKKRLELFLIYKIIAELVQSFCIQESPFLPVIISVIGALSRALPSVIFPVFPTLGLSF